MVIQNFYGTKIESDITTECHKAAQNVAIIGEQEIYHLKV